MDILSIGPDYDSGHTPADLASELPAEKVTLAPERRLAIVLWGDLAAALVVTATKRRVARIRALLDFATEHLSLRRAVFEGNPR